MIFVVSKWSSWASLNDPFLAIIRRLDVVEPVLLMYSETAKKKNFLKLLYRKISNGKMFIIILI